MRILQINKFFYLKGGPERYMFCLSDILKAGGHDVAFFSMEHPNNLDSGWNNYFVNNVDYEKRCGVGEKARIFKNTIYSREAEKNIERLLDDFKADIAHMHNFNHQLTPSILFALNRRNIPIVMTVHDYKLICPSYTMFNHGEVCERCKGKRFYRCFTTKCHKDSFSKSFLAMLESYMHHQILDSYRFISYFLCPSTFIMNKLKEFGLRKDLYHIPNFIDNKRLTGGKYKRNNKLVYWGRLSREKGIYTMIEAARNLPIELEIIGEGPLAEDLARKVKNNENIKLAGYLSGDTLFDKAKEACAAIVPSEYYENNPYSVLEAFMLGLPVVGARIGGIPELVREGNTGILFEPGDTRDLGNAIEKILADPNKAEQMGKNGRTLVETEYNFEKHYGRLMQIYDKAIAMKKQR